MTQEEQQQSLSHRKVSLTESHTDATLAPASLLKGNVGLQRERRRVTFSEDVRMRLYNRTPMLKEDKAKLWYTEDEIRKQRKIDLHMIARIRRAAPGFSISTEDILEKVQTLEKESSWQLHGAWDIRGLESLLDGGHRKARNRLNCALAVLMEQDRQDLEGGHDECAIAQLYERSSRPSLTSAYRNAELDRKAVETSDNFTSIPKCYDAMSSDFPVCVLDKPVVNTLPSRAA